MRASRAQIDACSTHKPISRSDPNSNWQPPLQALPPGPPTAWIESQACRLAIANGTPELSSDTLQVYSAIWQQRGGPCSRGVVAWPNGSKGQRLQDLAVEVNADQLFDLLFGPNSPVGVSNLPSFKYICLGVLKDDQHQPLSMAMVLTEDTPTV